MFSGRTGRTIDEAGVENVSDMLPDTEYQYTPSLSQQTSNILSVHGIYVVARTNMEYIKPASILRPVLFSGSAGGQERVGLDCDLLDGGR